MSSIQVKKDRYSYFPIEYHSLEKFYNLQVSVFWVVEDIDFSKDREHWDSLDSDSRRFLEFILFFFAQADGIINENLIENFQKETSVYKEAQHFYIAQAFFETIHNKTYSVLIETFFRDHEKKNMAFNAIQHYPVIGKIADWMFSWMTPERPLSERVVAFACIEGVLFTGAFAAIYWIKKRDNILPGLCTSNELIARDEAIHALFAVELYKIMTGISGHLDRLSESRIHEIVSSAMDVAEGFIREALHVDLIGMRTDDMVDYVKCTADFLCVKLGYSKLYSISNPFDWMAIISLPNKTNFFEKKVTEYKKPLLGFDEGAFEFDLDADF